MEEWKDISTYEGLYQVSNFGNVKSLERVLPDGRHLRERILKGSIVDGYRIVGLSKYGSRKMFYVHRLVAQAFVSNPKSLNEVDHIDTIRLNNRYDNLRWVTRSENNLNPITRSRLGNRKGCHISQNQINSIIETLGKHVSVYRNQALIYKFRSYGEVERISEEIFGFKISKYMLNKIKNSKDCLYRGYEFYFE